MDGGISLYLALATTAASAGTSIYTANKQAKDAEAAAKFNATQSRQAAGRKAEDDRENALRSQESRRKYIAGLRANLLDKGNGSIEGGAGDFLNESVGDLQLRVMDQATSDSRTQTAYANQAFGYDFQAEQASTAGKINTVASALTGFNSIATTAYRRGMFDKDTSRSSLASPINRS